MILEKSNNIVVVQHICAFINSIVEAPPTDKKRTEIKEELVT